jgi:hypothetical protein
MADLKVLSSGKEFFQIDSGVAAVLLEAFPAAFERIERGAKPAAAPKSAYWATSFDEPTQTKRLHLICPTCTTNFRFADPVETLPNFMRAMCTHSIPCPAELLAWYGKGNIWSSTDNRFFPIL